MNKLELPNLDRWRAGETPDENMFNEIQDAQEFVLDPPAVKVWKTASQTINNSTFTALTFQMSSEDNCKNFGIGDTTAMWTSTQNSRLTARLGGWYEIYYTVVWASTTDSVRRLVCFDVNGGPETLWQRGRRDTVHLNDNTIQNVNYPVFLNVGDYVQFWVLHFKGSSTSVIAGTELGRRTQVKMKWVSL